MSFLELLGINVFLGITCISFPVKGKQDLNECIYVDYGII